MEILKIIFDNLALLIILLFIIMFRKPIFLFLTRIRKVAIPGVGSVEAPTPTEQKIKKIKKASPKLEAEIKEIRKDKEKENSGKLLWKEYKKLSDKYLYERNLNSIFGTQLDLLEYLSRRGTSGEKYINLKDYYDDFSKQSLSRFPNSKPPLMIKYFEFLETCKYIEYIGAGDERIVKITPLGNRFLSYIKDQYPGEYRPFRSL